MGAAKRGAPTSGTRYKQSQSQHRLHTSLRYTSKELKVGEHFEMLDGKKYVRGADGMLRRVHGEEDGEFVL